MSRPLLAALLLCSLSALSCQLPGFSTARPAAQASAEVGPAPELAGPIDRPEGVAATDPATAANEVALAFLAGYIAEHDTGLSSAEVSLLSETILGEARARGLDPALVLAVLEVESSFDAFAVSGAGALGLMQILPGTGEELAAQLEIPWLGPQTLFDPIANVRLGVAYLEQMLARYGDVPTALAAYNWGPGRIDGFLRRGRRLPIAYSHRVLERVTAELDGDVST